MKTVVMLAGAVLGITEEELHVGEVVKLGEGLTPLVVREIREKPQSVGFNPDADPNQLIVPEDYDTSKYVDVEWEGDYQYIAYLSYNEKAAKKYKKHTSDKLEKRMAQTLGGKQTIASGAFNIDKGDVKSKEWLGEHKYTDAKSYRFASKTWAKISKEGFDVGRTPILEVVLDQSQSHLRLMFIGLHDFYEKVQCSEEEFVRLFYINQLKPKAGKNSVLLDIDALQLFINQVLLGSDKIPGWFVSFNEKTTVFGLLAKDFETIFKHDDE